LTLQDTYEFLELCQMHTINQGSFTMKNLKGTPCVSRLHLTAYRELKLLVKDGKSRATSYRWVGGEITNRLAKKVFHASFVVADQIRESQKQSEINRVNENAKTQRIVQLHLEAIDPLPNPAATIAERLTLVEKQTAETLSLVRWLSKEWGK